MSNVIAFHRPNAKVISISGGTLAADEISDEQRVLNYIAGARLTMWMESVKLRSIASTDLAVKILSEILADIQKDGKVS